VKKIFAERAQNESQATIEITNITAENTKG
jgi:hypothetical protein